MAPLSTASRVLARSAARAAQQTSATTINTTARLAAVASSSFSTSVVRPEGSAATFKSPFRGASKSETAPDFGHYLSKNKGNSNALFGYFMVGTLGAMSAAGAKSTIQGTLVRTKWGPEMGFDAVFHRRECGSRGRNGLERPAGKENIGLDQRKWRVGWTRLTHRRVPRQHERLRRRPGHGQGRG